MIGRSLVILNLLIELSHYQNFHNDPFITERHFMMQPLTKEINQYFFVYCQKSAFKSFIRSIYESLSKKD